MFKAATGWLGWPPETALITPVGQIELAMAGKVDFLKKTNPWGSSDTSPGAMAEPDRPAVAAKIRGVIGAAMDKVRREKEEGHA